MEPKTGKIKSGNFVEDADPCEVAVLMRESGRVFPGARLAVYVDPEAETMAGGKLIVADAYKSKSAMGTIVAVGLHLTDEYKSLYRPGQRVCLNRYAMAASAMRVLMKNGYKYEITVIHETEVYSLDPYKAEEEAFWEAFNART